MRQHFSVMPGGSTRAAYLGDNMHDMWEKKRHLDHTPHTLCPTGLPTGRRATLARL